MCTAWKEIYLSVWGAYMKTRKKTVDIFVVLFIFLIFFMFTTDVNSTLIQSFKDNGAKITPGRINRVNQSRPPENNKKEDNINFSEISANLPFRFEINRGQAGERVKFLSRGRDNVIFLTPSELLLGLGIPESRQSSKERHTLAPAEQNSRKRSVLKMIFLNANKDPLITGRNKLQGKSNYFIGNNPADWHTDIPHYEKVLYEEIYDGINLLFYGNRGRLEYDFIVSPGSDPGTISIGIEGADHIEVDARGNLVMQTAAGKKIFEKPFIYQEINGRRTGIPGGYVLHDQSRIGFQVSSYDNAKPLVIDPVLQYLTSFDGSGQDDVLGIATDNNGNIYLTGTTSSADLPTTAGVLQPDFAGPAPLPWLIPIDAYVAKLNPSGSDFIYLTYLGGSNNEENTVSPASAGGIAVDSSGYAYVIGQTQSSDFPTTAGVFQPNMNGSSVDLFVAKINTDGSSLIYSTYLGGYDLEIAGGIAVDAVGNAYLTGATESGNIIPFPTTPDAYQANKAGGWDSFVTQLNTIGTAILYSTFLGGTSFIDIAYGIDLTSSSAVYVSGVTESSDFPVKNAWQGTFQGGSDIFTAKLDVTASGENSLIWSTYLGGSDYDNVSALAVDPAGNAYITGSTPSEDFPRINSWKSPCAGEYEVFPGVFNSIGDAFAAKFTSGGSLSYSTCMGGSDDFTGGYSIAVDTLGHAYVTGWTQTTDFPPRDPFLKRGFVDFVAKLETNGSGFVYLTHISAAQVITLDSTNNALVAGSRSYPYETPITVTKISPETSYRFVVLADSRGPDRTPCETDINKCVNKAGLRNVFTSIKQLNPQPDFIFFTGDMIYGSPNNGNRIQKELNVWRQTIELPDSASGYTGMGVDYVKHYMFPIFGGHERNKRSCSHNVNLPCTTDEECGVGNVCHTSAWEAFSLFFDPVNDNQAGLLCQYHPDDQYGNTVYYCDFGNDRFFSLNNDCTDGEGVPDDDGSTLR